MEELIRKNLEEGKLPCEKAFAIARELRVKPLQVGRKANEMGVKITRCQLGLFGYGSKAQGTHRIIRPLQEVPPALEEEIRRLASEEGLACAKVWAISRRLGISKLEVASAAEALGIRIIQCQLGCF
ncbi:MAG: hypothetical protein DRI61_05730 [Chloroflexi bacterium]|nr:MAG: hypothetical protein DRI61_05730 [Chloroflexota bacterium]HDN81017.1 hypothetical protein [Chloroflexota bacterium]